MSLRVLVLSCVLLMLAVARDAHAAKWTVVNTAATGVGSLKAAVDSANAGLPGVPDTIAFAIPGAGPHFITRTSVLSITAPAVLIDGYTQAGSSVNTLATGDNAVLKIVLNGGTTGVDAIEVLADSCRIRGLVIGGSWDNGIVVPGGTSNHVIEGNFIGVNPGGTTPLANVNGIYMVAAFNRIGGTTAAARNVISGNTSVGIALIGAGAIGSVIGNYIGTNKNGTAALGNNIGIQIAMSTGCNIGGTAPGSGNLISANTLFGITMQNGSAAVIQGNLIGTDASGLLPVGNNLGIYISNSSSNQIGGTSAAARNVISASAGSNIYAHGAGSFNNMIQGNFIGTDVTGLSAFSNAIGILFYGADSNQVGGPVLGQGNVICGQGATAIHLEDTADFNTVSGNYIGVGSDGVSVLTNGMGIDIVGGRNNVIGGAGANQGNIIAHSLGGDGIRVTNFSTANRIRNNSIFDNAMYGIDLNNDGPTPFDTLDPDIGPNELQNAPILTSAVQAGGELVVSGYIWSEASKTYLVQLFQSGSCDGSGYGEGEEWIDTFAVSTSPAGYIGFSRHIAPGNLGSVVTATATGLGSTSEFSNCVTITPPPVDDTLRMFLFSPVSMVVTDPQGDSIGIDSASGTIFNTILNTSNYDTTSDVNSSGLTGPDGSKDDIVTIPHPYAGPYQVRMFVSDNTGSTHFTLSIRIDGNQQLVPDDYHNQSITALGNTVSPVYVWTASTTLPGDANADGNFTAADIIFLVNYVFKTGPATPVPGHGDVNCSGAVTSADIISMVNFVFKSGLPPCSQSGG